MVQMGNGNGTIEIRFYEPLSRQVWSKCIIDTKFKLDNPTQRREHYKYLASCEFFDPPK
jgi:hypothetical protein